MLCWQYEPSIVYKSSYVYPENIYILASAHLYTFPAKHQQSTFREPNILPVLFATTSSFYAHGIHSIQHLIFKIKFTCKVFVQRRTLRYIASFLLQMVYCIRKRAVKGNQIPILSLLFYCSQQNLGRTMQLHTH